MGRIFGRIFFLLNWAPAPSDVGRGLLSATFDKLGQNFFEKIEVHRTRYLLLLLLRLSRRALSPVVIFHYGHVPPHDGVGGGGGGGRGRAALPERAGKLVRVDGGDGGRRLAGRGRQLRRRAALDDL